MTGSQTWGALRPNAVRLIILAITVIMAVGIMAVLVNNAGANHNPVFVNDTANTSDGSCDALPGGNCTLKEAIEDANGGFADIIKFDLPGGSGIIDISGADLPAIIVHLIIDAGDNDVIVDGGGAGGASVGFEALANGNGYSFSLIVSGSGSLTIRDIAGDAVRVCGRDGMVSVTECDGSPGATDNVSLGTILIDDVTIGPDVTGHGVHVEGDNLVAVSVLNSDITSDDRVLQLIALGTNAVPPVLGDNTIVVSGNTISNSGASKAVRVDICHDNSIACDLASDIKVTISNNPTITGGAGNGGHPIQVFLDIEEATAGSTATVDIIGNGTISSPDETAIDVVIDIDDPANTDIDASVTVDNNTSIAGGAGATDGGVAIDVKVGTGTSMSTSTVKVTNNPSITAGGATAVDIDSEAGKGDDNKSTVWVIDNGNITATGVGADGVNVDSDAGNSDADSSRNISEVIIKGNGDITADDDAVFVNSLAGGQGDNITHDNKSLVTVKDNGAIFSATEGGVEIVSLAGNSDATTTTASADRNISDVIVDGQTGNITGGAGEEGVLVDSFAGVEDDGTANFNLSKVTVINNLDISGGADGVAVTSDAGVDAIGDGDDNRSEVTIGGSGNRDITGGGTAFDDGVEVLSNAGGSTSGSDRNASIVKVMDNQHISPGGTGGDDGIHIESDAGDGNFNTSEVTVSGQTGIISAGTGVGDDAVSIDSDAGNEDDNTSTVLIDNNLDLIATGGNGGSGSSVFSDAGTSTNGDRNTSSVTISNNREVYGNLHGVDIDVAAGGGATGVNNNANATVTGNHEIEGVTGHGVKIDSDVCCDSANRNTIIVSNQTGDITGGGDDGIEIGELSKSTNIINIEDNAGTITGTGANASGIEIETEGDADDKTVATIARNDISNSTNDGVEIKGDGDWRGSVIQDNTITFNGDDGVLITGNPGAFGIKVGPTNTISGNAGIGVSIVTDGADENTITKNSIFDNGKLGIDLEDLTGVGCTDLTGPNECIPFPDFAFFTSPFKLGGSACVDCIVEIFVADNTPDNNDDHGEGKTWLRTTTADSAGNFTVDLPCGLGNVLITSTATGKTGETSEFSENVKIPGTPSCIGPTDTPTVTPGGPATDTPTPTATNTPVTTGSITVCKDTNPETDDGTIFDFDTDIPGMVDPDLEDDECDTQTGVAPDDYEIIENPPAGWELDDIDCDGIPVSRWDDDLANNRLEIELEAGDDVECTFTNIDVDPLTSSISVSKDTDPEGSTQEFEFDSDVPGLDDFDLFDDETEEATDLAAGEYVITEQQVPGWNLVEIDCTGTDDSNIDVDLADNRVTVDLEEGEDVECTFTNEQKVATATATPVPTDTPVPTNTPVPTSTNTPVPPTNTPTNTPVIPATPGNTIGDVNKNGVVNAIDAQLILQAEAGFITLANPKNADVNLDGMVNSIDAFLIQQFVAANIPSLPV